MINKNRLLKKNDLFTAYCYTSEVLGESFKNFAVADFDPQEEIIFYSREPFEGFNVRLIFKNLIDNVENNSYYIFATGAEAIEQEFVPKTTMNGVIVTEKVHKFFGKEEIVLKKSIHFWSDKEFRFSRNLYRQILPQKK